MSTKEYEEFALNVQTISVALNNAVEMSMNKNGTEFLFSPLSTDYIHENNDDVSDMELISCVRTTAPLSRFWTCIDPEADVIGISCNDSRCYNHPVYSIRFYKVK